MIADHGQNERLAFIDFEASGLSARSWPIEVGWAFADGAGESFLISPSPEWAIDAWDQRAAALHGVTQKMLSDLGINVSIACDRLCAALERCAVYSDAPDWDAFWMMRLFDAAGRKSAFRLQEFARLLPTLSAEEKDSLIAKADRLAPRRHRAAEDAMHMATVYRLATSP